MSTTTNAKKSTKATTTAKGSVTDSIEAAEAEALEAVQTAKAELASARESVSDYELAAEEAEDAVDEIVSAWESGDETIPASAHSEAVSEAVKAKALHTAAQRRITKADRSIKPCDKRLATIVTDLIGETNPGYPFAATFLNMPDPSQTQGFVVQTDAAKGNREGVLSGDVVVRLYREAMYRPLNEAGVKSAAERKGMQVEPGLVQTTPAGEGREIDEVKVVLHYAYEAQPVLVDDVSEAVASKWASRVAQDLLSEVTPRGTDIRLMQDRGYESRYGYAQGGYVKVSNSVDADGNRLSQVDLTLTFRDKDTKASDSFLAEFAAGKRMALRLADMLPTYEGAFAPGMGIVQEASITSVEAGHSSERTARVRFVFASRAA